MDTSSALSHESQAIEAALDGRFEDAIKINSQILHTDPNNVNALSRLGRAYFETGKLAQAKKCYTKVLELDPYNPIATKNLKILKTLKSNGLNHNSHNGRVSSNLFLQEPGKTKAVSLSNVAEPQKLSRLYCGMAVKIVIRNHKITIQDPQGSYLGVVPDDVAHRLVRLIRGGNKYEVFIKSVKVNGLSILIREVYRSKRFKNQPSFLENSNTFQGREVFTSLDEDGNSGEDTESDEEGEVEY